MPLPTNNKGAECGSPCSSKGIPILTLRGRFSPSHRAHPQPRRGVTAVGDSRGAPHRGWERRRDGARRGTALQAAPSLYLRGTPSERPRRGSRTPRIAAGARGSPATRPAALTCLRDNAEPQPEGQRANSLHLRGCGRFGAVRSAPRPSCAPGAPQLRRRAAAGGEGAPGPLPFPRAARRPPPNPAGRRAGTGRGGAVRGGRRGGGGGCTCGSGQRRGMAAVGIATSSRPTRSSASPRVCLPATGVHTLRVDAHGSYLPACLCAPWKLTPAHVRSCTPRGHTCVHTRTAVPLGITDHPPAGHPHAPAAAVLLSAPTRTHKHVQQTLPLAVHPNPRASHTLHSFCSFSQTHLSHPGAQRVDGSSSGMAAGC